VCFVIFHIGLVFLWKSLEGWVPSTGSVKFYFNFLAWDFSQPSGDLTLVSRGAGPSLIPHGQVFSYISHPESGSRQALFSLLWADSENILKPLSFVWELASKPKTLDETWPGLIVSAAGIRFHSLILKLKKCKFIFLNSNLIFILIHICP
jgi:hypothetical protein